MVGRGLNCPTLPGTEGFPGQRFFSGKTWIVQNKTKHLVTLVGLYSSTCNEQSKRFQMVYCSHQFTRIHLICHESSCLPSPSHQLLSECRSLVVLCFSKLCFSNFIVYQNHLKDLLKHRLVGKKKKKT